MNRLVKKIAIYFCEILVSFPKEFSAYKIYSYND